MTKDVTIYTEEKNVSSENIGFQHGEPVPPKVYIIVASYIYYNALRSNILRMCKFEVNF